MIFTAEILLSFSANPELTRSKDSIANDDLVTSSHCQFPLLNFPTGDQRVARQPGRKAHNGRPAKGTPD